MPASTDLNSFLESVMNINVLRMGGASAGILGSTSADSSIVNDLKKGAYLFATEYRKSGADYVTLERLSNEMYGFLQTLQLTYTLSEKEANKFINQLQKLMNEASN
jgi:hypothetical protein